MSEANTEGMSDFDELVDLNGNWTEYDVCPDCDGDGGWHCLDDDIDDDDWVECGRCEGTGRA